MKKIRRNIRKAIRYFRETFLNKLYALIMFMIGWLTMKVSGDATAFVFITLIFVVPLILEKKNCIVR